MTVGAVEDAGTDESVEVPMSVAQWARARALTEALDWVQFVTAGALDEEGGPSSFEAEAAVEALALRWARLIETGEVER